MVYLVDKLLWSGLFNKELLRGDRGCFKPGRDVSGARELVGRSVLVVQAIPTSSLPASRLGCGAVDFAAAMP